MGNEKGVKSVNVDLLLTSLFENVSSCVRVSKHWD